MTQNKQLVHLATSGATCVYPGQIAIFHGIQLPFLAQTDTNPPTNSKMYVSTFISISTFMITVQNTFGTLICRVNMKCTSNIGIQPHFMVFGYLIWLRQIPIHQLTQNFCFNAPFHLQFIIMTQNKHLVHFCLWSTCTYPQYWQTATCTCILWYLATFVLLRQYTYPCVN